MEFSLDSLQPKERASFALRGLPQISHEPL